MSELIPKSAEIPDSDYVIVGGTGDLALRKIYPALCWRYLAGQITTEFRLIVAARSSMSVDEFAGKLRTSVFFCNRFEHCGDPNLRKTLGVFKC